MRPIGMRSMVKQTCLCGAVLLMAAFSSQGSLAATPMGPATWGTPDQPWGTRRPVTSADRALVARYRSGRTPPTFSSDFKNPAQFRSEWQPQTDEKAGLKSCRRPENAQSTTDGLRLRTLAARDCKPQWSTGSVISTFRQRYGFFEARMKIADTGGMNNAFWLTTNDRYEIDIAEVRFPGYDHMNLCNWAPSVKTHTVGLGVGFREDLSKGFHDYGVLWTPAEIIFEVDGDPVGAIVTRDVIDGAADVRFSTALGDWAGKVSDNPIGHDMVVQSVRVFAYEK
jgi:beta-glucanase (GH16 family)